MVLNQYWGKVWGTGRYLHVSNCPSLASQVALLIKNPPANVEDVRDTSSIPEWGRSPGGGHGNPLQYSCLKNSMDGGAWWEIYPHELGKRHYESIKRMGSVEDLHCITGFIVFHKGKNGLD